MLTRNYDRVQWYFPMRAIGLAVAERGLRAYFELCPDGMVTKAGIPKNLFPRFIVLPHDLLHWFNGKIARPRASLVIGLRRPPRKEMSWE